MASVDQCLELIQLVCCLFPRSSISAVPLGWQSVKKKGFTCCPISALLTSGWNGFYSDEKAMTCLKKMRAKLEFVVTCVPHLWSLDLSLMLADC